MLELRPNCERCSAGLPPDADARICSFECTFCAACAEGPLRGVCPNCGGGLEKRPIRPPGRLAANPPAAAGPPAPPVAAANTPAPAPTWIAPVTLAGRWVRLEPLHPGHAADLLDAADPELFRHTPQQPPEWSVRGFEMDIARVTTLPKVVAFAIVLLESGRAVGRTTYMDIRAEARGVEIGRTWIARAHHGGVVNPESKLLLMRHAFEGLSPPAIRVQFCTGGTNLHSQAAIAKLGGVREGVLRRHRMLPPADPTNPASPRLPGDTVCFSILADEWPKVKQRLEARVRRD